MEFVQIFAERRGAFFSGCWYWSFPRKTSKNLIKPRKSMKKRRDRGLWWWNLP